MDERWSARDAWAIGVLLLVFALFVARSWLGWGHLDFDYGREMLVPERLAQGDAIYRDVRYFYGPLSPWLHALGYRLFGPRLAVLYASGLASSALLLLGLYAVGRALGSRVAALLGALLVCADLMFVPGHTNSFSYVFPYAFPALHGLLLVTLALAAALATIAGGGVWTCAGAGAAAGLALVAKQEWGVVALVLVGATALALLLRSGRAAAREVFVLLLSCAVPALAAYGALAAIMPARTIFARGLFDPVYFGWRLSWLIMGFRPGATTGQMAATLLAQHARAALVWAAVLAAVALLALAFAPRLAARRGLARTARVLALVLLLGVAWSIAGALAPRGGGLLRLLPPLVGRWGGMPLFLAGWLVVELVAVLRTLLRGARPATTTLQRCVAVLTALVPLARVPAALEPRDYANFALPLALVVLVIALVDLLPRGLAALHGSERAARAGAILLVALVAFTIGRVRFDVWRLRTDELVTPRGTMRFYPGDPFVAAFRGALAHVLARSERGDTMLAIPAEASLSFLTGRGNHLYEIGLIAVVASDGDDRAFAAALERDPPELILVSNRSQVEYGRKGLGVDYGRAIAAWIGAHYDVEASYGEAFRIDVYRRRRAPAPASLPAGVTVQRDLTYATVDGVALHLDLYRPEGATGPLPVLLFLHGGGWVTGDKGDALPYAGHPAHAFQKGRRWPSVLPYLQHGIAVVSPQYRLGPLAPAPAAVDDVRRALAWIGSEGPALGLDPQRVAAMGVSAGGHLALLLGLAPGKSAPRLAGVIDLYGPTDVVDLLPPSANARPFARQWVADGPGARALAQRLSPIAHVAAGAAQAPPVLIVHSDADDVVPYEQARRLDAALRNADARVELVTLPGARHGFLTDAELALVEERILAFLRAIGLLGPAS